MKRRTQQQQLLIKLAYAYLILCFCKWVSAEDTATECMPRSCGNLTEVKYPFGWEDSTCGLSSRFLLSNCSAISAAPVWTGFTDTYNLSQGIASPPEIIGLFSELNGNYNHVNLSWANHLDSIDRCDPLSLINRAFSVIPLSINLNYRSLAFPSIFHLSIFTIVLLFNCSETAALTASSYIQNDTKYCSAYSKSCDGRLDELSCYQYTGRSKLNLQDFITNFSCTNFQFFIVHNASLAPVLWTQHALQLTWSGGDISSWQDCAKCEHHNGSCGFVDDSEAFHCFCSSSYCRSSDRRKKKIIVGVSVALAALVSAIAVAVLWLLIRRRNIRIFSRSVGSSGSSAGITAKLWSKRAISLSSKFGPLNTEEFPYDEILEATDSFADDRMVGDGGFGAVYVGLLRDGRKVAVKRLYHESFRRMNHFYNEMKILSRLKHRNLVKCYGFCCQDNRDLLLVFEYLSKGTVFDQLHAAEEVAMMPERQNRAAGEKTAEIPSVLPWRLRLRIALETAEALSYLHNVVSPPIFHRDVKSTNILLDDHYHAKLADFGLSRLVPEQVTHVSTAPQGTPGYVDPDYQHSYQLTDKSDVFSFGVVLMELVSGKLPVDLSRQRKEINLSSLTLTKIAEGCWKELVDPCLEADKDPDMETCIHRVVELAFECLQAEKDDRPYMSYVAAVLNKLYTDYNAAAVGTVGFSTDCVDEEDQCLPEIPLSDESIKLMNTRPPNYSANSLSTTASISSQLSASTTA